MEKAFDKAEELANNIKEYVNNRSEAIKFTAAEKASAFVANLVAILVVLMFFGFFIGFSSLALAEWLSTIISSKWITYLITAILHFSCALATWSLRSKLIRFPVMNSILKQLLHNDEKDQ